MSGLAHPIISLDDFIFVVSSVLIAALAGIFHGYAYGEAIIGAEITSLLPYLAEFIIIQLTITLGFLYLRNILLSKFQNKPFPITRFCGLFISAVNFSIFISRYYGLKYRMDNDQPIESCYTIYLISFVWV